MAYSDITNAEIDTDSPVTQTLMTKLRDNPLEVFSGGTGYMNAGNWVPVDWTFGDQTGDGTIYDFANDGAAATVDYALGNGWEYLFLAKVTHETFAATPRLEFRVSQNAGSTFGSALVTGDTTAQDVISYNIVWLRMPRLDAYAKRVFSIRQGGGTQEAIVTGDAIDQVRFRWSGGESFDENTLIRAFRRREYITAS